MSNQITFLEKNKSIESLIPVSRMKQALLEKKLKQLDFQKKPGFQNQFQPGSIVSKTKQQVSTQVETDVATKRKKGVLLPKKEENLFAFRKRKKLFLNWPQDIFYESRWLNKLINKTMRHGKKGLSEKILMEMMQLINQKVSRNPLLVFHQALNQIKPVLTVLSRRVGRRIYQVPVPLQTVKQYKTALKWLTLIARNNRQNPVAETLAQELIDTVFFKRSEALKRKNELYETVVKNRAYTHYRWI